MTVSESGATWFQKQLERATGLSQDTPLTRVIVAAHRALADAPSVVVTGTLDDALSVEERPNMPGTIDEWPNWSLALPKLLEDVETDPTVLSVASALERGRQAAATAPLSEVHG
jgi:4-alpha-glucanotransferase